MFECHHRLNGHELEQTPGGSEGQGSLVCCRSWGCNELGHNLVTDEQHAQCFLKLERFEFEC